MEPKNVMLARHIIHQETESRGKLRSIFELVKNISQRLWFQNSICPSNINLKWLELLLCQGLVENKTLNLQTAFDQARSLDVAQQSSTMFSQPSIPEVIAPIPRGEFEKCSLNDTSLAAVISKGKQNTESSGFCGNSRHSRNK